jgi:ribosomal protein S18 acetylase RimI-like enzyme
MAEQIRIRKARPADARQLAELMNAAGEGIPAYLWARMAEPGEDPLEFGTRRVRRREGAFSYRNMQVAVVDEKSAGMLLSYRLPDPYDIDWDEDIPSIVQPAMELESLVPGSWYVNAVATVAAMRGRGIANALMARGERLAGEAGADVVSLIVAEQNSPARRLYERLGYRDAARRARTFIPGFPHEGDWLLMRKDLT